MWHEKMSVENSVAVKPLTSSSLLFALVSLTLLGLSGTRFIVVRHEPVATAPSVPGDPLTGSGNVNRIVLTYDDLMNGFAYFSPMDDDAFALPADAAHPDHTFEGRLELFGEAIGAGFNKIEDIYNNDANPERLHIPEFDYEFVQNGSHLIPTQRGLIITDHPSWNYIIGPGRVWKENGDNGYSRASFPFALVEKNQNCTHNGVMTFLFNDSGVSMVWYQITQETCLYFKADFWGLLDAAYHPGSVAGADQIRTDYVEEVINKFPTASFEQLAVDYPGTDLSQFGNGITAEHMTTYGLVIGGVNYISGCGTRYGEYAYCGSMRLPSFSTAKSAFAGVALMRLAQKYGAGAADLLIKDYVSEYASSAGDWTSVTFDHTLDMATGNYFSSYYMLDEDGLKMAEFFQAESYMDKIALAFDWPNKAACGTKWVYRTSDTFILTRAMHNYLQSQEGANADIFQCLVDEVFKPVKIGPGAYTSLRTSENNWQGQAFGGYGLWWTQDEIAKIATLLNNNRGVASGMQILHPNLLASAMQDDPNDRGLDTGTGLKYNNGFWAKKFTPEEFPEYTCTFWTPFMSGYGGIIVVMMPNGSTYYYFSDNNEFSWYSAVSESNKMISHCLSYQVFLPFVTRGSSP
jgi:hypothetical protein